MVVSMGAAGVNKVNEAPKLMEFTFQTGNTENK